jgi:RimJ/RimL family protein N-acetyltransferase
MNGPAYKIKTDRLLLRPLNPNDAILLKQTIEESLEHLLPYMSWAKREPETIEQKIVRIRANRSDFDADKKYEYGIFLPDESKLIGMIALMRRVGDGALEIGYWLHKDFTKKGYMIEATKALIKVAFEVNEILRIEIHMEVDNKSSQKVPQTIGLTHEATLRRNELDENNQHKKLMIWVIFKDEYEKSYLKQQNIEAYDIANRRII